MEFDPKEVFYVINELLGPNGCPWDKKQTPDSLCEYLIEEVFELVDAIRKKDKYEIEEELGDVYFLLFFITYLLNRDNGIDVNKVFSKNAQKMKNRHPHVFGDIKVSSEEEILKNWEKVKQKEKNHRGKNPMDSIPSSLPPLLRAYRIHSKAEKMGFTWLTDEDQKQSVLKELEEFLMAKKTNDYEKIEEEFGDLLFSLVEYGRRNKIKANGALQKSINKFLDRFNKMISLAKDRGLEFEKLSQEEKDKLWEEVKERE